MRWPWRSNAASGTSMISGTSSAAAGDGSRMPSGPSISRSSGDQARNASDFPRASTAGSASLAPCSGELAHQGRGIDLAADRRVAGDDHAGRDRERQAALGHGLRRGRALLVAQRIALRQRGGAEVGLGQGCRHAGSCSAVITRLVRLRTERVIQYSRDVRDRTVEPRRTGYPPSRGMTNARRVEQNRKQKTKVRSRDRR